MKTPISKRLPRSTRKHLRARKAFLRKTLPAAEAERAIQRLERRLRETATAKDRPAAPGDQAVA